MRINHKQPRYLLPIIFICFAFVRSSPDNHSRQVDDRTNKELFHIPYASPGTLHEPAMVLVLHGDAPFSNPSYQYRIARQIADENNNVVAVGILRPGYTDNEGNRSAGKRGNTTGDNYTKEVLEAINDLATHLRKKYNPSKVILVGHSGGAAISANLLSEYPGNYAGAVLIACPCDLHLWRKHMKAIQPEVRIWDKEVGSLSPIEELKNIDDAAQISVIHGGGDEIVPLPVIQNYVKELEANKKNINFYLLDDQGHEIAFNKQVFEVIKEAVE